MIAYEFSTTLTHQGQVTIPSSAMAQLPLGSSLRVILLVEEESATHENENDAVSELETFVASLQNKSSKSTTVIPASGKLGEHLANPVTESDPTFDEKNWNSQWDEVEKQMKELEFRKEQQRLRELQSD